MRLKVFFFIFLLKISFLIVANNDSDFNKAMKIINKYKTENCKFNKEKSEFQRYNSDRLIIEGYWLNFNKPYGEWIEKTYTNKVVQQECYVGDMRIMRQYSQEKLKRVLFKNKKMEVQGFFYNDEELLIIIYNYTNKNTKIHKRWDKKNGKWDKILIPTLVNFDSSTELFFIDINRKPYNINYN